MYSFFALSNFHLHTKIIYTIICISLYRFGVFIPLPGIEQNILRNYLESHKIAIGLWGGMNLFSGGAIEQASIFALGIIPYISASIVMSLMIFLIPSLKKMSNNNQDSYNKIQLYIVFMAILISFFQSYMIAMFLTSLTYGGLSIIVDAFEGNIFIYTSMITLIAGTVILIWLSDLITKNGIGNGVSVLIITGIVSKSPEIIYNLLLNVLYNRYNIINIMIVCILFISIFSVILIIETSEFRFIIYYTKINIKGLIYRNRKTYFPIKINTSGVIAPLFASTVLTFPSIIFVIFKLDKSSFLLTYLYPTHSLYQIIFISLIIFFVYFYTNLQFNIQHISENMIKSNSFFLNIKPGKDTEKYIINILYYIIMWGILYLSILCIFPIFIQNICFNNVIFNFCGISLLIIVNVALDIIYQIENLLIQKKYSNYNFFLNIDYF